MTRVLVMMWAVPLVVAAGLVVRPIETLDQIAYQRARATGCTPEREEGTIKRSRAAVAAFKRMTACPSTGKAEDRPCPGYKVDHSWPLCGGGCDAPENMQYQPSAEAAEKDVLENLICARHPTEAHVHAAQCALHILPGCAGDAGLPAASDAD